MPEHDFERHTKRRFVLWLIHCNLGLNIEEIAAVFGRSAAKVAAAIRKHGLRKWTGILRNLNDDELEAVATLLGDPDGHYLLALNASPDRPSDRIRLVRESFLRVATSGQIDWERVEALGLLLASYERDSDLPDRSVPYRKVA